MSIEINGRDTLTLHEMSILCQTALDHDLSAEELGKAWLEEDTDNAVLKAELEAIDKVATGEAKEAAEIALGAFS